MSVLEGADVFAPMQGGGRGRAKVAEVYGDVLPDDVIVAEGQWHVAMRNFRSASRALRNDRDEAASDVTANVCNVVSLYSGVIRFATLVSK